MAQGKHLVQELNEYVPAGHEAHAEVLVALAMVPYVPAGHCWHEVLPAAKAYVPEGQSSHLDKDMCGLVPAGHATHWAALVPPTAVETLPAGQSLQ